MAEYEIINHGWNHCQYFQGCGVALTPFADCITGMGYDAKDAYQDAVAAIYEMHGEQADHLHLPTRPRGISKKDKVPPKAGEEYYWYVSIRYSL